MYDHAMQQYRDERYRVVEPRNASPRFPSVVFIAWAARQWAACWTRAVKIGSAAARVSPTSRQIRAEQERQAIKLIMTMRQEVSSMKFERTAAPRATRGSRRRTVGQEPARRLSTA